MSGIFLAYSRADRALAYLIVRRLRGLGVEVWWDEDMPGVDWQDELARPGTNARFGANAGLARLGAS